MSDYRNMSGEMAADALAIDEGVAVSAEDARERYCDTYVSEQLAGIKARPLHESDIEPDMSIWHRFSERQFVNDRLNVSMCRMLAYMGNASDKDLDDLRTVSGVLADVADVVRSDMRDMLLEEAGGYFDRMALELRT